MYQAQHAWVCQRQHLHLFRASAIARFLRSPILGSMSMKALKHHRYFFSGCQHLNPTFYRTLQEHSRKNFRVAREPITEVRGLEPHALMVFWVQGTILKGPRAQRVYVPWALNKSTYGSKNSKAKVPANWVPWTPSGYADSSNPRKARGALSLETW